jgi:hypothetical protein
MQTAKAIVIAIVIAAGSATARAHDTAPIDRTQAYQMQQIQEARRTGQLTRREYEGLVAEQARIADMERRAQRNGVTGREYREIRSAQAAAGAHIAHESADRQVNVWRRWKSRFER